MQISPNVHALKIRFAVPVAPSQSVPRFVYAYLIGRGPAILLDAGVAGAENGIMSWLSNRGVPVGGVGALALSHSHPDHLGAALPLQLAGGFGVWAHSAERAWIEDVTLQARERPVPGFEHLVAGSVKVDRLLRDGEVLVAGDGLRVEVLHTPGHSPGSISLLVTDGEQRALLCGDAVPQPGSMPIYDDVPASAETLRRLLELPGIDWLLSSWDEPRRGADAHASIRAGLRYLRTVDEAVRRAAAEPLAARTESSRLETPPPDSVITPALVRRVVAEIGLPPFAANALVARSLAAHVRVEDVGELRRLLTI